MNILILVPQSICYGIVENLSANLGNALEHAGANVIYFDIKKTPAENLIDYMQKKYTAVIDIYSGLLLVKVQSSGEYLWNCIDAPIYQVFLDFPIYIENKLNTSLHNYYALCLDRHYCAILKDYMPNIIDAYFFPMAGKEGTHKIPWAQRRHNIVFIGTYSNYKEWLVNLNQYDPGIQKLGYTYFCIMRDYPDLDQIQAFKLTLKQFNISLSKIETYQWFKIIGGLAMSVAAYQREQMITTLLQAGLEIEVYGDSWKSSPLTQYSNLIINKQINESEYVTILEQTKISLNILYSNKASYSERLSYSMLNGAICICDKSEYLYEEFIDNYNIIFYELNNLQLLPKKIKWLLNHPEAAQKISDSAYIKAKNEHTWKERAEQLINIIHNSK